MSVLITGAAGFIGSHVVRRLVDECEVVGLDDLSSGSLRSLEGVECRFIEGSILDPEALAEATRGVRAIVHLAARPSVQRSIDDPVATHEVNTVGTMRVLEAARSLDDALVIVASSSSVYGANPELPKRETMGAFPMSPYGASKLAAEQYTLAWGHSFGLRVLPFRFFNVFGPRQAPGHAYAAVVPAFVDAALRNEPLIVHGDGSQTRDFTYVGTVTDVIADAIERRVSSQTPVNLAYGTRTSLLELIERLSDMLGRPLECHHVPNRVGDVPHSQADNQLLQRLFPNVSPASLMNGLRDTVAWMETEHLDQQRL